MGRKSLSTMIVLAIGGVVISCVSPFYGTAKIEPGFHADVGVGVSRFVTNDSEWILDCVGPRLDTELRWGFNRFVQVSSRMGIGFGYTKVEDYLPINEGPYILAHGALGVQAAYPLRRNTPALRLELSYQPNLEAVKISPVLLWGFGNPEWLTLGVNPTFFNGVEYLTVEVFAALHPWKRWTFFAGLDVTAIFSDIDGYPIATIGAGYTLGKFVNMEDL